QPCQHSSHYNVGDDDTGSKKVKFRGERSTREGLNARRDFLSIVKEQPNENENADHSGYLIRDSHDTNTLRRAFDRSQDGNVRVRRSLQQRQTGSLNKQTEEEKRVRACLSGGNKYQRPESHREQAY